MCIFISTKNGWMDGGGGGGPAIKARIFDEATNI